MNPSYPGQLKFLRKNLFNVVLLINLTNSAQLQSLRTIFSFIQGNIPFRFGVVLLPHKTDPHDPGKYLYVPSLSY